MTRNPFEFHAGPDAKPTFKERFLWTIVLGLFFFLAYGSANQISSMTAPHPSIFWEWERSIPFVAELIIPYMSSDILFVIAFALAPTRLAIQKLGIRCGLAIVISVITFLVFPLEFSFDRPPVTGWPAPWFDVLSLDRPYNQFPSLHISLGFIAWHTIVRSVPHWVRFFVTLWFALIFASTLMVYQHHFIDLPGGIAVIGLIYWLVPERGIGPLHLSFISPRHLHMALRYLIGATIAVIGAFLTFTHAAAVSLLLIWVAIALLGVATSYVLVANNFLRKTKGRYGPVTWGIFWPYILGSIVNWRYWRHRVPNLAEVHSGIWIGSRPASDNWPQIQSKGIREIIDLCPEVPINPPTNLGYRHIPMLDIAIPSPEVLDQAAKQIDEATKNGPTLVHCALGMSRSVLAISAWLIRNGEEPQRALDIVSEARPERVNRPYMHIALDLYHQHIQRKLSSKSVQQ